MEGTLEAGALVSVLRDLQRQKETGILTVQGEDEIIAFSMLEGMVVSADALNQSMEDGLGEVLVKESLVSGDDFAGLVAEYQAGGGRVTELLLERSFLSREQLLGALRRLTYRLSRQALTWKSGEYRFYQGDDVAYEVGVVPLGVDELLVRATDDLGVAGPFGRHVAEADKAYASVLGPMAGASLPNAVIEEDRPEAETLYLALDGERTLARIAEEVDIDPYGARALAGHWLECGLIRPAVVLEETQADEVSALGPIEDLGLDGLAEQALEPALESEPEAQPEPSMARPVRKKSTISAWPPRLMGVGLLAAALWVLVSYPGRLLLPFPWQGGLREAFNSERRELSIFEIERAATTFFLLEGRYPEDLSLLVADRLLQPGAVSDPEGKRFVFSAGPASYVIQTASAEAGADASWARAISENFLLDPQFLATETAAEPPLVLLD